MRSFFQKKLWVALLAVLALGALTALAVSLDAVSFEKGKQFGHGEATPAPAVSMQEMTNAWEQIPAWKILLLWSVLGLLVLLIGLLLSPKERKRLIRIFVRMVLIFYTLLYIVQNYGDKFLFLLETPSVAGAQETDAANMQPVPEFQPPQITPIVSYLISFGFALVLLAIVWLLYRGWKKYLAPPRRSLDEIAHIARSSLRDLNSGRDTSDVIVNCYLRMSDVVAEKQKLRREDAMTPHEFSLRLERAGLPADAVRRLTRLFETVRYGDKRSAPKDVSEAVNCLNTILHYCGETI